MTQTIEFVVPGMPVGKGRPKFARRGNFVTTYTPEKTASYENLVKVCAVAMMNKAPALESPVRVEIAISVLAPASWSNKKRQEAFDGKIFPTTKPDLDNCAKIILDAMNSIVFKDDKQVVSLSVVKTYDACANTKVRVVPL